MHINEALEMLSEIEIDVFSFMLSRSCLKSFKGCKVYSIIRTFE